MSTLSLVATVLAFAYLLGLLWLARAGESFAERALSARAHAWLHGLALGVYCSSWTVFGAIGSAVRDGWGYLPIYLGPILLLVLAPFLWARLVKLKDRHRLGSLADFFAARHAQSGWLASTVALVSLLAVVPYLALQLRAMDGGLQALGMPTRQSAIVTSALLVMLVWMTLRFGVRDASAVQQRPAILLVLACESLIKLAVFVALAVFAWTQGPDLQWLGQVPNPEPVSFVGQTLLSGFAVLLLPRMFQVAVVECRDVRELSLARRVFIGYLLMVSLAVLPLAALAVQHAEGNADFALITVPNALDAPTMALLGYVAGLSAASAMLIAALVALSTLVSNHLVVPLLRFGGQPLTVAGIVRARYGAVCLAALASLGWYQLDDGKSTLAQMGLVAFAAVAQFAPALLLGLFSDRARGANAVLAVGIGSVAWFFWLWLPQLLEPGQLDQHAVTERALLILAANVTVLGIGHWLMPAGLKLQFSGAAFLAPAQRLESWDVSRITRSDLQALLERVLGSSAALGSDTNAATSELVNRAERALAARIGAESARELLQGTLGGQQLSLDALLEVLDRSAKRVHISESLLKATFEHMHQAVSVVDSDLRLSAWNGPYQALFQWPRGMLEVGRPIRELLEFAARESGLDDEQAAERTRNRIEQLQRGSAYRSLRTLPDGRSLDIRGEPLPGGGFVTTFFDVTEAVTQARALAEANLLLEQRVAERTAELENLHALKNRFIAAASHDLLQPLSAARLYLAAAREGGDAALLTRVDSALAASEDLLGGLTDLSRLDTGQLKPQIESVDVGALLRAVCEQYALEAEQRGLSLRVAGGALLARSDARLLRRIVSNFVANALRYTAEGGVLLGARRRGQQVLIQVFDTGPGLVAEAAKHVFDDRDQPGRASPWGERGLGLGLAGCRRIALLMGATLNVRSVVQHGSCFSVTVERASAVVRDSERPRLASAAPLGDVLVVENDSKVASALSSLLVTWGMRVTVCGSGTTALDHLDTSAKGRWHWAIVDYHLGESSQDIDGLSVLRALREFDPELRLLLCSAASDATLPQRAQGLGAYFMRKPMKPAALRALLASPKVEPV